MRKTESVLWAAAKAILSCCLILLCGCGAGPGPSAPIQGGPKPGASAMAGNWLLVGSLPDYPVAVGTTPSFGLQATFDVSGNQISGIVTGQDLCQGTLLSESLITVVSGSVATDGSFTLTAPTSTINGLTTPAVAITGVAPTGNGDAWTGNYSVTTTAPNGVTVSCPGTLTGSVSATKIPLVSGVYTGSTVLQSLGTGTGTPVTVAVTLHQGGAPVSGPSAGVYSDLFLTGSVQITGSSCASSGATSGAAGSGIVEGSNVTASFTMNDGSSLRLLGSLTATDGSRLGVHLASAPLGGTGTCANLLSSIFTVQR